MADCNCATGDPRTCPYHRRFYDPHHRQDDAGAAPAGGKATDE